MARAEVVCVLYGTCIVPFCMVVVPLRYGVCGVLYNILSRYNWVVKAEKSGILELGVVGLLAGRDRGKSELCGVFRRIVF